MSRNSLILLLIKIQQKEATIEDVESFKSLLEERLRSGLIDYQLYLKLLGEVNVER